MAYSAMVFSPLSPQHKVDLSFQRLPKILWEEVEPTPLENPRLASVSPGCASAMGLELHQLHRPEFLAWINGEKRIPGDQRISTRYAGHQFGHWAGQLGDGRAISLLEFVHDESGRWELQTKGSGQTPFSRRGDGKAVIRSSVREYLCSEAMAGLGIPTSRALALVVGSDPVQRETIERSAIVARAFPSNLRFGHYEYCFHFQEHEALKELMEYAQKTFFPETRSYQELFHSICKKTASLLAKWMSVGFCHGVMNSDNMSILGITIDYGPFAFMEKTDLSYICNHSDEQGRYAFHRQPGIALWNLERLGVCFTPFLPKEAIRESLAEFTKIFSQEFLEIFRQKMGLQQAFPEDEAFMQSTFSLMENEGLDFTVFFRSLSDFHGKDFQLSFLKKNRLSMLSSPMETWMQTYGGRTKKESLAPERRRDSMNRTNPALILRNHIAQEVIMATEAGDFEVIKKWLSVFANPHISHAGFESYEEPTPEGQSPVALSCSS